MFNGKNAVMSSETQCAWFAIFERAACHSVHMFERAFAPSDKKKRLGLVHTLYCFASFKWTTAYQKRLLVSQFQHPSRYYLAQFLCRTFSTCQVHKVERKEQLSEQSLLRRSGPRRHRPVLQADRKGETGEGVASLHHSVSFLLWRG